MAAARFTLLICAAALMLAGCGNRRPAKPALTPAGAGTTISGQAGTAARQSGTAAAGFAGATLKQAAGYVIAPPTFTPLPGAQALYGIIGGAGYQFEVPQNWNGELVLYAHGFTGEDPVLFVQQPPLRNYLISNGFAWAASSFSASGYAVDAGLQDTMALRDYFASQVGTPQRVYIYGTSMGGHVVVSAMEQHPDQFAGGFSECGVVAGVEELDYLMSWVALASYLTSTPLLPIADTTAYRRTVRSTVVPALGSTTQPTIAGQRFEDVIESLTGGPRPWRDEGFQARLSGNFDLAVEDNTRNPTLAARAATNTSIQYHVDPGLGIDDAQLNAGVPRIAPDPGVRNPQQHPDFAPRTGALHAPLLTIHTTGDHFVPISLEQSYRRTVDAAGAGDLLVQRAIRRPAHCQFTEAEREQAFGDLVKWVENGVKPNGDDLSNPDLSNAGLRYTMPLLPGDPGTE